MRTGWWRGRRLSAAAAGLAAVGALAAWTPDPAAAGTTVLEAEGAQILLPGGQVQPAHRGDAVPHGATVRTAPTGQATLLTAGRQTWLGAATTVRADDGARLELAVGSVMVDARRAPGLALVTDAAELTVTRGALLRVERGPMLRVAQFAGSSSVVPHGRRASTPVVALHQVQVATGGLPGPVTPLALTSDRWERALIGDLVGEDADLTGLAVGLDGPGVAGRTVLAVLPATLRTSVPAQVGTPRSEETLAWGIAAAAAATRPDSGAAGLADRYAEVRRFRVEGGSWAVVARLAGARVDVIEGLLERLLDPAGAAADGTLSQVALSRLTGGPGGSTVIGATTATGTASGTGPGAAQPGPVPSGAGPLPGRSPSPGSGPLPDPLSGPLPGPAPVPTGAAQGVVDTVVALLPTPLPTPTLPTSTLPGSTLPGSPSSTSGLPVAPLPGPALPDAPRPVIPLPVPVLPVVPLPVRPAPLPALPVGAASSLPVAGTGALS